MSQASLWVSITIPFIVTAVHMVGAASGRSRLFLEQIPGQPAPPKTLVANIRIMVPDVDRYGKLCSDLKLPVVKPIAHRDYGLSDFTVVSPDGIGLRFASWLAKK